MPRLPPPDTGRQDLGAPSRKRRRRSSMSAQPRGIPHPGSADAGMMPPPPPGARPGRQPSGTDGDGEQSPDYDAAQEQVRGPGFGRVAVFQAPQTLRGRPVPTVAPPRAPAAPAGNDDIDSPVPRSLRRSRRRPPCARPPDPAGAVPVPSAPAPPTTAPAAPSPAVDADPRLRVRGAADPRPGDRRCLGAAGGTGAWSASRWTSPRPPRHFRGPRSRCRPRQRRRRDRRRPRAPACPRPHPLRCRRPRRPARCHRP